VITISSVDRRQAIHSLPLAMQRFLWGLPIRGGCTSAVRSARVANLLTLAAAIAAAVLVFTPTGVVPAALANLIDV